MKTLSFIITALLITGCEARIDSWIINRAITLCEEHGGIDNLDIIGPNYVRCNDGRFISIRTGK